MRYHVLATDYDGTLAQDGRVADSTVEALRRLRASGRRLLLVTGRELDDLLATFPAVELFDRVVAENGGLLYDPGRRAERPLADAPDPRFVARLRERGVEPLSVGRVIVATWEPHQAAVLEAIQALGLELQVTFNKGAVMVLPAGVTKASGLAAALDELAISAHNAVGIGDAENDHAFLAACEASVAVANALATVKERADLVTRGPRGEGVEELIDGLLADDLRSLEPALDRHAILLGRRGSPDGSTGTPVTVEPYGRNLLVAGPSGSGKSSLTGGILERLGAAGYQFCLVDPEGDYEQLSNAVVLGDAGRPPGLAEAFEVLARPGRSVVLNLLAVPLDERPAFCQQLLPRFEELRARTGRPHWLLVDEAHHLLPPSWQPIPSSLPRAIESTLLVTVHPDRVAPAALAAVDAVAAVGDRPDETLAGFARAAAEAGRETRPPSGVARSQPPGSAVWWQPATGEPFSFRVEPPAAERDRHRRKYAAGSLPPERSFFFRGPDGRLNLRAQNLQLFIQLAEGVDDETWRYHLERGDYSTWIREMIKDRELADQVAAAEAAGRPPAESRAAIREAIEGRYTAAA